MNTIFCEIQNTHTFSQFKFKNSLKTLIFVFMKSLNLKTFLMVIDVLHYHLQYYCTGKQKKHSHQKRNKKNQHLHFK